jgi:muconolactone delta-isomerase
VARASNVKPIKISKRTGRGKAYRAKVEAMLAELASEQLVEVWRRVCPFAIASEFDLPDRQGIIQDLADFAVVLQPNLAEMTADQVCRWVEKYGGAANRRNQFELCAERRHMSATSQKRNTLVGNAMSSGISSSRIEKPQEKKPVGIARNTERPVIG